VSDAVGGSGAAAVLAVGDATSLAAADGAELAAVLGAALGPLPEQAAKANAPAKMRAPRRFGVLVVTSIDPP
jgi:hypothetical protein